MLVPRGRLRARCLCWTASSAPYASGRLGADLGNVLLLRDTSEWDDRRILPPSPYRALRRQGPITPASSGPQRTPTRSLNMPMCFAGMAARPASVNSVQCVTTQGSRDSTSPSTESISKVFGRSDRTTPSSCPRATIAATQHRAASNTRLVGALCLGSGRRLTYDKALCASLDGFTLHAATRAGGLDAEGREALLRYVLRPPVAQERVEQRPDGLVARGLASRSLCFSMGSC